MKPTLLICAILALLPVSNATLLITQVYPDPTGSETTGEAIELYNQGNETVAIGGYTLRTKSSNADATIPSGVTLLPSQHYLIADAGWNASRDDLSWPPADHEEAITLTNVDGGVALVAANGTVLDAIGWGDTLGLPPELYETQTHFAPATGESLQRIAAGGQYADTGNNLLDFAAGAPSFHSAIANAGQSNVIDIIINISSTPVRVLFASFSGDELDDEGTQLAPFPGRNKTVNLSIILQDSDGPTDLADLSVSLFGANYNGTLAFDYENGSALYVASITVPFYQAASTYTATINAVDKSDETSQLSVPLTILAVAAIEVNSTTTMLGSSGSRGSITLQNIGNSALDLELRSTNFTSDENEISAQAVQFRLKNYANNSTVNGTLSTSTSQIDFNLLPGQASLGLLELNLLPQTQLSAGVYRGKLMVAAIP